MGETKSDECVFCSRELEEWEYEYFKENGERAINPIEQFKQLNICQSCVNTLKNILGIEYINSKNVKPKGRKD